VKARRFRVEKAVDRRGFSRWVQPRMDRYLLSCCDCSLVHEMQFRIVTGGVKGGNSGQKMHVQLRARRAERHTRAQRAKRKS